MTDIDPAFMNEPTYEARADIETLGYLVDRKQPVKGVVSGALCLGSGLHDVYVRLLSVPRFDVKNLLTVNPPAD